MLVIERENGGKSIGAMLKSLKKLRLRCASALSLCCTYKSWFYNPILLLLDTVAQRGNIHAVGRIFQCANMSEEYEIGVLYNVLAVFSSENSVTSG